MVKYRATSLDKTFASNIRKLFLLKISLFLYIPSVILISKCCSAFPELAVIVLNWERSMLTLSFLCSHMCLLWKWISSQFGWTHDNDTITLITTWAFLFIWPLSCYPDVPSISSTLFSKYFATQTIFPPTYVEIKKCKLPFSKNGCQMISSF